MGSYNNQRARIWSEQVARLIIFIVFGGTFTIGSAGAQPALYDEPSAGSKDSFANRPGGSTNLELLRKWFRDYDNIRRQAQMGPSERQRANDMMSQGLAIVMPGQQKMAAQQLLNSLVDRYRIACDKLKNLPFYPESAELHKGYYQYFSNAGRLFSDYLRVQDNLFVTDPQTGQPLASQLGARKEALESLDQQNKAIDAQLRNKLGVQPYHY